MKFVRLQTSMVVLLLVICLSGVSMAASEINWQVISGGGTNGVSANYQLQGTTGQVAAGVGVSAYCGAEQ